MAYKKFIKRDGKIFGPYYYESYRDKDGNVKTRYLENYPTKKSRKPAIFLLIVLGIIVLSVVAYISIFQLIGFSVTDDNLSENQGAESNSLNLDNSGGVVLSEDNNQSEAPAEENAVINETLIEENLSEINQTSPEINQTINQLNNSEINQTQNQANSSQINETQNQINTIIVENINETNETIINETIQNNTDFAVITKRARIVIGKPVRWVKTISGVGNLTLELPKEAENIIVKIGEEAKEAEDSIKNYNDAVENNKKSIVTGNAFLEIEAKPGFLVRLWAGFISLFKTTGNVVQEISENLNSKEMSLENIQEQTAIEYETPAPAVIENDLSNGKQIKISADEGLGYTDVLAYSELDNFVSMGEAYKIKLVWKNENKEISFDYYDLDSDGNIDYIEWNIPHFSEQIYEIIYITKAIELDSNKKFVRDVYDYVKSQDNNWVSVADGNYIRVEFEKNLTNTKDITLYARGEGNVEVYEENQDEIIIVFNISGENTYKNYLVNLSGEQDVFDLKFLGNIEVDYIVDPQANNSATIFQCGTIDNAGVYTLNQSISGSGTCLVINANDVTIDFAGFSITGDGTGYGVDSQGTAYTNLTLKNGNIISFSMGIHFDGPASSLISNITLGYNSNSGVFAVTGTHNIENSTINYSSTGINFNSVTNSIIRNNVLNSNSVAVSLGALSATNYFYNTSILNCTTTTSGCISLAAASHNNVFELGIINGSNNNLIHVAAAADNLTFKDFQFINSSGNDLYLMGSPAYNNTFINTTYVLGEELLSPQDPNLILFRKWYYKTYVNDSSGTALSDVNISVYNYTNEFVGNLTTNSSGYINLTSLIWYISTGGVRVYDNYTLNATKSGYVTSNHTLNLGDNNLTDFFTLTQGTAVTDCMTLNQPNTLYTQTINITALISPCINISVDNVTFNGNGFYITNTTTANGIGIYSNSTNSTIKNSNLLMNISGSLPGGAAIKLSGSNFSYIFNNSANYEDTSIYLINSRNVTIENNSADYSGYGVYLSASSHNNTIKNFIARHSGAAGIGIYVASGSNFTLYNASLINNTNYGLEIVSPSNYANVTLVDTSYTRSGHGIYVASSHNNTFNLINSSNATGYGFVNSGGENSTISNSIFNYNDDGGIAPGKNTTLNNVTVNYNDAIGIQVSSVALFSVYDSNISYNTGRGVSLLNQNNYTLDNLSIIGNRGNGIYILNADNVNISNVISKNNTAGIYIAQDDSSSNITLMNVTAYNSSTSGIYIASTTNISLNLINASKNTQYGVYCNLARNISINNASAYENTLDGYYSGQYCDGNIINLTSKDNVRDGVSFGANDNYPVNLSLIISDSNQRYGTYFVGKTGVSFLNSTFNNNSIVSIYLVQMAKNISFKNILINDSKGKGIYLEVSGGSAPSNITFENVSASNSNKSNFDFVAGFSISGANISNVSLFDSYFENFSISQFTNVSFLINKTGIGQINFTYPVNGNGTNLSNDIFISNNLVYVNNTIEGLNRSANVTLAGLTGFNNPAILRNTSFVCNSSSTPACYNFSDLNLSSVSFNVSAWSNYSIGEMPEVAVPVVSLVSPADSYSTTTTSLDLIFNVSDTSLISNCSLIINGTINETNTSILRDINQIFSKTFGVGVYSWSVNCSDGFANTGNSSTNIFSITADSGSIPDDGGGGSGCSITSWRCENFSECLNQTKQRTCISNCLTQRIENQSCGSCISNYNCSDWGLCNNGVQIRSCNDLNNCNLNQPGTIRDCKTFEIINESECEYDCSEWSECETYYIFNDAMSYVIGNLKGYQKRICTDNYKCKKKIRELKECSLKLEVYAKNVIICDKKYIEVYRKDNNQLISRIEDNKDTKIPYVNIKFITGSYSDIDCSENVLESPETYGPDWMWLVILCLCIIMSGFTIELLKYSREDFSNFYRIIKFNIAVKGSLW